MLNADHLQGFEGQFLTAPDDLRKKLENCKAVVFDWDGVFNDGTKDLDGNSPFSEIDSMGTNLLRFNFYLRQLEVYENGNKENFKVFSPPSFIISGEENKASIRFAARENFTAIYGGFKDKTVALNHICENNYIRPDEIIFVFDDVLDLNVAEIVGVRILIGYTCNPALQQYIKAKKLADYITASSGGSGGLREACELALSISGRSEKTFENRIEFTDLYKAYIQERSKGKAPFYSIENGAIIEKI